MKKIMIQKRRFNLKYFLQCYLLETVLLMGWSLLMLIPFLNVYIRHLIRNNPNIFDDFDYWYDYEKIKVKHMDIIK